MCTNNMLHGKVMPENLGKINFNRFTNMLTSPWFFKKDIEYMQFPNVYWKVVLEMLKCNIVFYLHTNYKLIYVNCKFPLEVGNSNNSW